MSVEQPLPEEWIEDLDDEIPVRVEEDKLQALGLMKAEEHGSYQRWVGGRYQLDYHAGAREIMGYEVLEDY